MEGVMKDLRSYDRTRSVDSLQYSVTVRDHNRPRQIDDVAVMIDMSIKGMGVLIDHSLQAGSIMHFKNGKRTQPHFAEKAVVKWSCKIDETTYRVGLKFI